VNARGGAMPIRWLAAALGALATAAALAQSAPPLNRTLNESIELIPGGTGIRLETTIFRPDGDGPFPLVVINHGKDPGDPKYQARARFFVATREFVRRGYAVALPMRAGFSRSTGQYVESGCNVEGNGRRQAVYVRTALDWLRQQPFVDRSRILLIGQSQGGLTVTALGTDPLDGVVALVNFAGGLRQTGCPGWEGNLARAFAAYGGANRHRMLWFYGDNDSYFPIELARDMHARYVKGGGHAELIAFGAFKGDAHRLFADRDGLAIWWPPMERLLTSLGLPTEPLPRTVGPTDPEMAKLQDAARIPHVRDSCRRLYEQFLDADYPRAYAISPDAYCGYAYGGEDPAKRALELCQRNAKQPCRLYARDERVVWE